MGSEGPGLYPESPHVTTDQSHRLPQATAIVVGIIIGASVFVQASEITARVPSLAGVTLAWVTAGLLTMGGALVCAELSSAFPRTGGVYVFLEEAFSPALGFLWGWAMFWSMHTGIAAAIATVFARYAGYFMPMGDTALRACASGAMSCFRSSTTSASGSAAPCRRRSRSSKCLRSWRSSLVGVLIDAPVSAGVATGGDRRRGLPARGRGPGSSPSAGGTWSPTPPRRP